LPWVLKATFLFLVQSFLYYLHVNFPLGRWSVDGS
jgi:hypothetical protein